MKPGGGKQKGGQFERVVCKALSLWVTRGKRGDVFWRSAMSGGRATVAHRRSMEQSNAAGRAWPDGPPVRQEGDITSVAVEGHVLTDLFIMECKHVHSLDMFSFVLLRRGRLWKFWQKLTAIAVARNKHAMLIAKQNNMPVVVVTDSPHLTNHSVTIPDGAASPICYLMLFDDMLKEPFKARVNSRRKAMRRIEPLPIADDE